VQRALLLLQQQQQCSLPHYALQGASELLLQQQCWRVGISSASSCRWPSAGLVRGKQQGVMGACSSSSSSSYYAACSPAAS
jgi:hypothetical protein